MQSESTGSPAKQFAKFVLVGGLAAAVNWLTRIALSNMGVDFSVAIVCAYVVGMATAYTLSKRFVFAKSSSSMRGEVARFVIVNMIALVQVWLVTMAVTSWVLPTLGWTWHAEALAHGVGVASPTFTSYFGHRYFTFGKRSGGEGPGDKRSPGKATPAPIEPIERATS